MPRKMKEIEILRSYLEHVKLEIGDLVEAIRLDGSGNVAGFEFPKKEEPQSEETSDNKEFEIPDRDDNTKKETKGVEEKTETKDTSKSKSTSNTNTNTNTEAKPTKTASEVISKSPTNESVSLDNIPEFKDGKQWDDFRNEMFKQQWIDSKKELFN